MKTNTMLSVAADVAAHKFGHLVSALAVDDLLRPLGLTRRTAWPEKLAFLGAGIVVGGVAALLFAPSSGAETRARIGKKANELGDAASRQVRELGENIREEVQALRPHLESNPESNHTRA